MNNSKRTDPGIGDVVRNRSSEETGRIVRKYDGVGFIVYVEGDQLWPAREALWRTPDISVLKKAAGEEPDDEVTGEIQTRNSINVEAAKEEGKKEGPGEGPRNE